MGQGEKRGWQWEAERKQQWPGFTPDILLCCPCSLKSSGCPKGQPGSSAPAVRHCCPSERAGFVPETTWGNKAKGLPLSGKTVHVSQDSLSSTAAPCHQLVFILCQGRICYDSTDIFFMTRRSAFANFHLSVGCSPSSLAVFTCCSQSALRTDGFSVWLLICHLLGL